MSTDDPTRRHAAAIVAATFGVLAMPAIARAMERVRIGYQKNGSLAILRQQHGLDGSALSVDWVEFTSGPPILEALNAGAVDFAATGDTPPIFAQAAGAELLYVGGQPTSGANEALLVSSTSPISTLGDLRGKRVAFTKGSSAHNFILKVLTRAGLKPADIQPVFLQPPDAGAAFRTGAVDAWAIWDPFFAIAEQEPTTRVLTTAEGVAPTNSFFLASRDFARRSPATISTLLDAINGVGTWARQNPDALALTMAEVTGVPIAVERVAAPRGVYAVQPMDDTIIGQQQAIANTFTDLHIIPTRIDIRSAVWRPDQRRAEVSR